VHVNPKEFILPGPGHLQFTDEKHGWINLQVQSGSADGGRSWTFKQVLSKQEAVGVGGHTRLPGRS
jgi:hypothetical protein